MGAQTPSPRSSAARMATVAEKLWHQGEAAIGRARELQSPLRARRYDVGRAGTGTVSNQTMEAACARADRGPSLYSQLVGVMHRLDNDLTSFDRLFERVMGKADIAEAKRKMRQPGSGRCYACKEYMPGTRDHRIVEGLCPKHYKGCHRFIKDGKGSRSDYVAKVRHKLGFGDEEEETE